MRERERERERERGGEGESEGGGVCARARVCVCVASVTTSTNTFEVPEYPISATVWKGIMPVTGQESPGQCVAILLLHTCIAMHTVLYMQGV